MCKTIRQAARQRDNITLKENARLLDLVDRNGAQIETQASKINRLNKSNTAQRKHIKALERELDKLTTGAR